MVHCCPVEVSISLRNGKRCLFKSIRESPTPCKNGHYSILASTLARRGRKINIWMHVYYGHFTATN